MDSLAVPAHGVAALRIPFRGNKPAPQALFCALLQLGKFSQLQSLLDRISQEGEGL